MIKLDYYIPAVYVFQQTSHHMTLNHLGACCNQVNIQSDGPASVAQWKRLGDYKKYENDSNVYKNIMDNDGQFLYKASTGHWMVCTNCQCTLLQNLAYINFHKVNMYTSMYYH